MKLWAILGLAAAIAAAEEPLTERAERHALRDKAVGLLEDENFAALDELAGELRSSRARFEDGSWRLAYFYEALDSLTGRFNSDQWQQHLARLQRWRDDRPESATARIVSAHALLSRGSSRKLAEQLLSEPARDPEWYHARLRLYSTPTQDAAFERTYREAIAFEPSYLPYYVAKARHLKHTRGPKAVERFAADTADAAKDDALYTRTLMWLLWSERDELLEKYGVSWPRMKRGFEKMQREYPTSVWIANNFAMFACMAGDRDAARAQFERIGGDWNSYVWRNEGRFEQWRAWARQTGDRPAKAEPPAALSRPYTGGPILDREILKEQAAGRLIAEDYDALEQMAGQFRTGKERLPEGAWKLAHFYLGLSHPPQNRSGGEDWTYWLELLEKWNAARPDSIAAPIALAAGHLRHAWAARGGEFASKVTDEGWQLFRERAAQARQVLEKCKATSSVDPHWYTVMLRVARAESWKRPALQSLFEEAIRREPAYHAHYTERAAQLLPRWFGRPGELEAFAAQISESSPADASEGLYARIALAVTFTVREDNFFEMYDFSWPKIRDAFRAMEKRYPDSAWNANWFCRFACMAGDKATARELFERIGDRWVPECWKSESRWRQWRQWAGQAE